MKSDDSARSGRAARSRSTISQIQSRRVLAVHRRQHAVGAGLHRQMQERHQLRHVGVRGDQVVVHVARMRGGVADAQQAIDAVGQCRISRPRPHSDHRSGASP